MHLSKVCVGMQAAQRVLMLNKGVVKGRFNECLPKPAHMVSLKERNAQYAEIHPIIVKPACKQCPLIKREQSMLQLQISNSC